MIGLFIGSFNPPTRAHFDISLMMLNKLDKVVFVPVNSGEKELISFRHRIGMLNTFINKHPKLIIDDIMKDYSYLNYRIIDLLKTKYQSVTLIMGSDLLDKLDTFDNYEYLLKNYSFIIIERKGFPSLSITQKKYNNYQNKFTIMDYQNDISSTEAREFLKEKKNLKNILDQDVLTYIKEHDLY